MPIFEVNSAMNGGSSDSLRLLKRNLPFDSIITVDCIPVSRKASASPFLTPNFFAKYSLYLYGLGFFFHVSL